MTETPVETATSGATLGENLQAVLTSPKDLTEFAVAHGLNVERFVPLAEYYLKARGQTEEDIATHEYVVAGRILDVIMAAVSSVVHAARPRES